MNKKQLSERDICTKFITPALEQAGWDVTTQIREEFPLTKGRIVVRGKLHTRAKHKRADYVLFYKPNIPIAVIEVKDNNHFLGDGMQQGLGYAEMLQVPFVFSSNGDGFLFHNKIATDGIIERELGLHEFPSSQNLWQWWAAYRGLDEHQDSLVTQDYFSDGSDKTPRYYQLLAINKTIEVIARGQNRILLVMATGTGKTFTAFQIIWRLWKSNAYGQIIVDECHHLSAFSFEAILKQAKARYVVGLTATPVRRDGHQPIIFMQCGSIRHSASRPETAPSELAVLPQYLSAPEIPHDSPIQEVFRILANDAQRNRRIAADVLTAYREGRKVLVLTERTEHLSILSEALGDKVEHCFILHGRISRKQRTATLVGLDALDASTPRVLLATGRLIGEGFDHAPLDTLALAMPISWKGTLQQYAGRLHREHSEKQDVRIYDYVENNQPQLARMWEKRQRGYRAMGYRILTSEVPSKAGRAI